jgi:hypothetical protein
MPAGHVLLMRRFYAFLIVCVLVLPEICLYAQSEIEKESDGLSWDYDSGKNHTAGAGCIFSGFLMPQLICDTRKIREYVLDERFEKLRLREGDVRAIDAIYLKSANIAEHNIARTLFLSLMAVLDHKKIYIKFPLIKSICMPLTFENDSVFLARSKHLPSHFYADGPKTAAGDLDKLQHFFGSAYLAYVSESPEFTLSFGNLAEQIEEKIVIGGRDDIRDRRTNKQGLSFGRDLLLVQTLLPSDYLTSLNVQTKQ